VRVPSHFNWPPPFISAVYMPAFRSILRKRGSIPGNGKRLGVLPAYFKGYRTVKLTIHVPLVPRLSVSAGKPPLPYIPSWYEQAQMYLYKLTFGLFQKNYHKVGWRNRYSAYATNRTIRSSTAGRDKDFFSSINVDTVFGSKYVAQSSQYRHWRWQRYHGDYLTKGGPLKEINFRFRADLQLTNTL